MFHILISTALIYGSNAFHIKNILQRHSSTIIQLTNNDNLSKILPNKELRIKDNQYHQLVSCCSSPRDVRFHVVFRSNHDINIQIIDEIKDNIELTILFDNIS